jgi:predicted metal-binding membrane protein
MTRAIGWFRRTPHWWVYLMAVGAWGVMLQHAVVGHDHQAYYAADGQAEAPATDHSQHGQHAHHHARHHHDHRQRAESPAAEPVADAPTMTHTMSASIEGLYWILMVVAMMFPLMGSHLQWVAIQTFRRRRPLALATWLFGYLGVWMLAGIPAIALRMMLPQGSVQLAPAVFLATGAFALTRWHRRTVEAHHGTRPMAPAGLAATVSELREGARVGAWCVANCWLWMLACTLTGHSMIAMVGCFLIGAVERFVFQVPRRSIAVASAALGAVALIPVLL